MSIDAIVISVILAIGFIGLWIAVQPVTETEKVKYLYQEPKDIPSLYKIDSLERENYALKMENCRLRSDPRCCRSMCYDKAEILELLNQQPKEVKVSGILKVDQ